MAAQHNDLEPAFGWAIIFTISSIVLLVATMAAADSPLGPALVCSLLALTAGNFLVGAAVTLAMGQPLPRVSSGKGVSYRLRFAWTVLGFVPPPGRSLRLALGALLALAFPFAWGETIFSFVAAGALMLGTFFLSKPKSLMSTTATEAVIFLAVTVIGVAAMFTVFAGVGHEPWRALGVLAALLLYQAQRAREVTALRWAELMPGVPPPPALDLSRYEVKAERKASEARLALPPGVEAQLVDSGSFRVDAAKMLDKLRQYQLSDPRDFLSAWLRCAAASGATKIGLACVGGGLELRFDGRAFSTAELAQPYQVLVDGEGEEAVRGRHFAYGLLGLYRLAPLRISVTSRGADGTAVMNVGPKDGDASGEARVGTVIRVDWPLWASWWRPRLLAARARARYGLGPAALTVHGVPVPDRPKDWVPFEESGWRGGYRTILGPSKVRLYLLGALVEELEDEVSFPVAAWLTHDALTLDISQSAVVRSDRLQGLSVLKTAWDAGAANRR